MSSDTEIGLRAEIHRLEAENTRLRARIKAADDITEALVEGGVDGIERCHKAIIKLRATVAKPAHPD